MKTIFFGLVFFATANTLAHEALPHHLDLELDSSEYRQLLKRPTRKSVAADHPAIQQGLRWGERLNQWLTHENNRRSPETALRLTNPGTRRGIPIDKPSIYSEKTIEADIAKHTAEMPAAMLAVLNGGAFPATLPLPDADFILIARKVDKTYQSSARFKSLDGWRSAYVARKALDVRSFHFFMTNGWNSARIGAFDNLPADEQAVVRGHLIGICMNDSNSASECRNRIQRAIANRTIASEFEKFYRVSQRVWNDFFVIPGRGVRRDVTHTDPNNMIVPFNTPSIAKFVPYLKDNVEDEFKWGDWRLSINYGTFWNGPRLRFVPGEVPHVDGLGGNNITMDSNQSIEEYESQWTIRHEFGHVIGLPDCYHEFYDNELGAYVNYQLDITDLMCSRAGDMNERIFKELKRVYHR